jgi:predicted ATPase
VVVSLRDGIPTTTLLVTSRTPLGVRGERRIRLDPLPLPEQTDDVDVVAANPAVRLFVDRAEAIEPGFSLTARNAASTAELVRHLEGLPLAIELAAARVSVLTPAGIHRRFRIRTELADPSADRPERHRTLAGTIDWSHRLLDRRAQRGLAALSVLRGSFDLAAAEAVSGDPVAGDVLAELVDASLVVSEAGDEPRFRLLEAVREFADARLTRADRRRITERHLEHFRNVAVTWCPLLLGADAAAAVAVLDGESENLDAAIDTLIERGETRRSRSARGEARAAAIELIDVLSEYWSTRGRARMALDTLTGILADVGGVPDRSVARAMFQAGSFAVLLSRSDEAEAFLSDAIARFEAIGDRDYLARSHKSLGVLAFDRRRFDDAERHHRASLELHRALGDRRAIAQAIQNLGNVLSARGDIEAAREHFEESLAIKREVGSRRDLASALMGLGNVADRQGDLAAAGAFHEECLSIARAIRDERAIAMSLANLGSVRARGGDLSAGIELLVESAELHHRSGSDRFAANSLLMIGLLPGVDAYAEWLTPLVAASVSLLASMDVPLPDETRTEVSDLRKRLERQLGTGAVAALYEQGERMTAAEAVRHAGSIRS